MEQHIAHAPAAFTAVRWIVRVILLVLVAAVLYAGWLAIANWEHIRV